MQGPLPIPDLYIFYQFQQSQKKDHVQAFDYRNILQQSTIQALTIMIEAFGFSNVLSWLTLDCPGFPREDAELPALALTDSKNTRFTEPCFSCPQLYCDIGYWSKNSKSRISLH